MEDVLDLYAEPYDPAHPVVCFDESPKQLIGEVRQPIPAQPGTPAREDTEYRRNGVRDLMMICEPKRGWRDVLVMERRTKIDFAHCMRHIVETYPDAEVIRVVLDNLNTHKPASLYEAFPPGEARAIVKKLEFHFTPSMAVGSTSLRSNWLFCPTCVNRREFPMSKPCAVRSRPMFASATPKPLPSSGASLSRMPDVRWPAFILAFQCD